MAKSAEVLVDWCSKEMSAADQQMELFGPKGVRAVLIMPDGSQQDITPNVLAHQAENKEMLAAISVFLKS